MYENDEEKKILLLNSGGFDSVLLAQIVRDCYKKSEIINLFFEYGQANLEQEKSCSMKSAKRINAEFKSITLPPFNWTNSEFYNEKSYEISKQELEMRNMVFISYALSIAKACKCDGIFMAIIKGDEPFYYDCSGTFLSKIEDICADNDIIFATPLRELAKVDLLYPFYESGLDEDDFFTCDTPVNGKPCGKCPDCRVLEKLMNLIKKMRN